MPRYYKIPNKVYYEHLQFLYMEDKRKVGKRYMLIGYFTIVYKKCPLNRGHLGIKRLFVGKWIFIRN